jgi:hypothetical protein
MIDDILKNITKAASLVDHKFFQLKTTYEPSGIVRERVFCYELYHQLRKIIGDDYPLTLNGEIDKRGHIDFAKKDRKNPDFVFHIPGRHEGNTLILEVKGVVSKDLNKDFKTIITFLAKYRYQAGVLLLYNHTLSELVTELKKTIYGFAKSDNAQNIYIITLPKANKIESVQKLSSIKK